MENKAQILEAFIPYLREFIERARSENPGLHPVRIPPALASITPEDGRFETSFGIGVLARIPWLAFFLPRQRASTYGVYPVLLYRREIKALSVCYGVSATATPAQGNWPRKWPKEIVDGLRHFGHPKYSDSYELRLFPEAELNNYLEIATVFLEMVDEYLQIPRENGNIGAPDSSPAVAAVAPPKIVEAQNDLNNFVVEGEADIHAAGLHLQKGLFCRFAAALLTKRFLVLTGLSGSGKTKLAHAFAAWISESGGQYRVVAVGADWTTSENLLGYQDALRPEIYRKPNNGALDLMLRARDDPERPYFLILDEMNLSHVERYFADMLSAIESGERIALHSAMGDLPGGDGDTVQVPPWLLLPKNLFIIGTVNVDETTYMFSPKVLDRANVIEFRATGEQIESFLGDPQPIRIEALAHKGAQYGVAFVGSASSDAPALTDLPMSIHPDGAQCAADLKARLVEAFAALAPIGAEFGFRTAYEISRFVVFHATLTGPDWQLSDALDAQVLQKLLPKLHGSERRLGPVLKVLEAFCTTYEYGDSLKKIRRMQDRLKDGFTSFAEA